MLAILALLSLPSCNTTLVKPLPSTRSRDRAIVEQWLKLYEEDVGLLATAVDDNTARLAGKVLRERESTSYHLDAVKCYDNLQLHTRFEWEKELEPRSKAVHDKASQEYKRIRRLPNVMKELKDTYPIRKIDQTKTNNTHRIIHLIVEPAVQEYLEMAGDYPRTLQVLCVTLNPREGRPYLSDAFLTDEWDARLEYDSSGKRNHGAKPDVWSKGCPHRQPEASLIGNWVPMDP